MPRDITGQYTLPPGNPVVDGTVIESTWANSTLADIATQLNNVITRDGLLGPNAPMLFADGTGAQPGIAFAAQPGLGIRRSASNTIVIGAGATNPYMTLSPTDIQVHKPLKGVTLKEIGGIDGPIYVDSAGSLTGVDFGWSAAKGSGMLRDGSNGDVLFARAGQRRMTFSATDVSITPALTVTGPTTLNGDLVVQGGGGFTGVISAAGLTLTAPLAITSGGTGGTTQQAARTALAVPGLATANQFTSVNSPAAYVDIAAQGTVYWDMSTGNVIQLSLAGNTSLHMYNPKACTVYTIIVRQRDVANRTFNMGGGISVEMPTGWGIATGPWQWTIISGYVEQTRAVFIGNSVRVI